MAATKRQAPPTHITVWIGLGMAAVGLLVALYAYTGTRVYDVTYAIVALVGGIVALAGILTSAWGRAIMSARASRSRRTAMQTDTLKLAEAVLEQPPTVAEPASKKRFDFRATARRMIPQRAAKEEGANGKGLFAFKTRAQTPPAAPADEAPLVSLAPTPAPEPASAPATAAVLERVTLVCPECGNQFTAEGTRPFQAVCPSCSFSAEIA